MQFYGLFEAYFFENLVMLSYTLVASAIDILLECSDGAVRFISTILCIGTD
jgi:hypothetical protein